MLKQVETTGGSDHVVNVVYESKTGNVERFVQKLKGVCLFNLSKGEVPEGDYVLVTHTTGFGIIPAKTRDFLDKHGSGLKAVSCSGNKIWGSNFAKSADIISEEFGVGIINKFEMSGTSRDVEAFMEGVVGIG